MRVPFVDLKAQYASIKSEVHGAIDRVLANTSFILGEEVRNFETAFSAFARAKGTVGVASGTAALQLALQALGVGHGDEVITTAHTFMATGEAVSLLGARPVFVDIDPLTFNLDPAKIEAAITPKTRAILPVHLYGQSADLDPMIALAAERGLSILEDAAQAHGAEYKGRRCGSIGAMACFSFYPGKNLGAYGDAGAVTGNDPALLDKVRKLRDHGRSSKYEHDEIGYGERIDALQAAILAAKLPHLEDWTEARRRNARRYRELLADLPLGLPHEAKYGRHVYHLFVVRTPQRDALRAHLQAAGVETGVHYPVPLHRQPAYLKQGYGDVRLPETEKATAEVLSLPMYAELGEAQIAHVAATIRGFFK